VTSGRFSKNVILISDTAGGGDVGDFNGYNAADWAATKALATGGTLNDDDVIINANGGVWRLYSTASGILVPETPIGIEGNTPFTLVDTIIEQDPAETTI